MRTAIMQYSLIEGFGCGPDDPKPHLAGTEAEGHAASGSAEERRSLARLERQIRRARIPNRATLGRRRPQTAERGTSPEARAQDEDGSGGSAAAGRCSARSARR